MTVEPALPAERLGQAISACDPLVLEVHPAIQVSGTGTADGLPVYVRGPMTCGCGTSSTGCSPTGSRLVTLVGGSSTGKTRAGWELAQYLDYKQPGRLRLWHPYDPTRLDAALADLDRVGPQTVVWLNEAQFYLASPHGDVSERIAAKLRTLLHDSRRGPVLVLATLWPQFWDTLTLRPDTKKPDPHAQARDLLTGSRVT